MNTNRPLKRTTLIILEEWYNKHHSAGMNDKKPFKELSPDQLHQYAQTLSYQLFEVSTRIEISSKQLTKSMIHLKKEMDRFCEIAAKTFIEATKKIKQQYDI